MSDRSNMSDAWRRLFGVDFFDSVVHLAVTLGAAALFMQLMDSPWPGAAVLVSSLVLFSWRRRRALNHLPAETSGPEPQGRIEELESRVAELEQDNARVMELEERLDFAERLLSQAKVERPGLPRTPTGGSAT